MEPDKQTEQSGIKIFHIDGVGMRPDGKRSGFAWVRTGTDRKRVRWKDGARKNLAKWMALIDVLRYVRCGSRVVVRTDSRLLRKQVAGRWHTDSPYEENLRLYAQVLIDTKDLDVEVESIPAERNCASPLLKR